MSCSARPCTSDASVHLLGPSVLFGKFHCHALHDTLAMQSAEHSAMVSVFGVLMEVPNKESPHDVFLPSAGDLHGYLE
jgi:hypothetical protein